MEWMPLRWKSILLERLQTIKVKHVPDSYHSQRHAYFGKKINDKKCDDSTVVCFDAKINFDDNAKFRQKEIFAQEDTAESDPREVEAAKSDLNYIGMTGNIGCLGICNMCTYSSVYQCSYFVLRKEVSNRYFCCRVWCKITVTCTVKKETIVSNSYKWTDYMTHMKKIT
jgi:hypothetical protein